MSYKINDTSEVWRDIVGYEGIYEVSSIGRVRNTKGVILKQAQRPETGYLYVLLSGKRKAFHANIQRLVAMAFLQNPNNYPIVNHINEDKTDNRVENLEWCTQLYNARYSKKKTTKRLREVLCKRVIQLSLTGIKIAEYSSLREAAEKTGIGVGMISRVAQGERTQTHGYIFKKI